MANEKRLIDITPLVDECDECMSIEWNHKVSVSWADAEEDFKQRLLDAPVVDAVEVKHGRWETVSSMLGYLCCSQCKDVYIWETWLGDGKWNYCPNCGADMRERKDND